ncbi:ABC transporter permease [Porphyromonas sp.]|uniref:ABC transporter permease n=1 Tax=Porphyromonas sp. TaxID=1924944 RepID=UPI0026DB8728|nr:ABC transporter permease [Porphyromonas sp.]MDO4771486.1 ABC transporter permease [Porphyromonas sp.]
MKRIRRTIYQIIIGAALINILWAIAALTLGTSALSSPAEVYAALPRLLSDKLTPHIFASLYRLFIGIPIALVMGVFVAWAMYRFRKVRLLLGSFVYLCYPIPKLALLPIVMILAGLGDAGKIVMIVLILLFQIIVNVRDSINNIPKESFLVATSLGASTLQILRHILMPATLPEVLSTLRVAIGTAISVLFVTETYGTDRGMGYFIIDAWMRLSYVEMYGGIVVLSIVGFILFFLTDIAEAYFCRWRNG